MSETLRKKPKVGYQELQKKYEDLKKEHQNNRDAMILVEVLTLLAVVLKIVYFLYQLTYNRQKLLEYYFSGNLYWLDLIPFDVWFTIAACKVGFEYGRFKTQE